MSPPLGSTNRDTKSQAQKRKASSDTPKSGTTPDQKQHQGNSNSGENKTDLKGPNSLPMEVQQPSASGSLTAPTLGAITTKETVGNANVTAPAVKSSLAAGPPSPAASTSSVTSEIRRGLNLYDPLEVGDTALEDLADQELEKIGEKSMELGDDDNEGGGGPPPPKKTWATIAKPKVQAFEVLYVHQGQKERTPIPRETFTKLYDKINAIVLQKVMDGESVPDEILWRSWKDGRGLIAVKDKETSEFMCQIIGKIVIQQNSFRAWHRGEFGTGRLVTTHLEGNSFKIFGKDKLMDALLVQNKLPGRHTGSTITTTDNGRLLRFFADKDLWEALVSRRENKESSKLWLKLGVTPVKLALSKAKEGQNPAAAQAKTDSEELGQAGTDPTLGTIHKTAEVVSKTDEVLAQASILLDEEKSDDSNNA